MSESLPIPSQDSAVAPTTSGASLRPASSARMPSLEQLAARMTSTAPIDNSNSKAPSSVPTPAVTQARPRLATSLLARASSTSLTTNTSAADSTAVQPSTTRSVSPALSSHRSISPAGSNRDGGDAAPSPANELTAEHLEHFNLGTIAATNPAPSEAVTSTSANGRSNSKPTRGYKNVPTLEAITERLRKARALSVDGTEAPPQPMVAPTTNDAAEPPQKEKEHPLQHPWTLYHDTKAKAPFSPPNGDSTTPYVPPSTETGAYEAGLTVVGEFDTVETFCRYFNWLKPPSRLERNSNYHLFKSGIKPMWEDKANANGGKWVLTMKSQPQLLDRCWSWLAMALVGEELDEGDEICGAVVSLRSKVDRIQLWTRSKEDVERINGIGRKLVKLLDISEADGIGLEFQYNSDERPTPQKFLSLQASFPQSGFRSTFSPHGGAFNVRHNTQSSLGSLNTSPVSGEAPGISAAAPPVSSGFVGDMVGTGRGSGAFGAGGGGAFGGSWRGGKK